MTHSPEYKAGFAAAMEAAIRVAAELEEAFEKDRREQESWGAASVFLALRALSPGDGWCRDMDAAPKDGSYILAWANGAPEIIFWSQLTDSGWTDGNPARRLAPTAWRHLPEPPREGE